MPIYKQSANKLIPVKEKKIRREENIKKLVEENLEELLNFQCLIRA